MDKNQLQNMLTSMPQLYEITPSGAQAHALAGMKKCRTHELGGRVLECTECGARIVQYNPCNIRGCPICYEKNQIQWKNKASRRILPTRHFHLVFTIPEHYTRIWLKNKKEVVESLFKAVKTAIKAINESEGLLVGSVLVFHSHGIGMSYKPHIHCALSGGGLDSKGIYRELRSIPFHDLEVIVKKEFESNIKKSIRVEDIAELCFEKRNSYKVYSGYHEDSGNHIIRYFSKTRYGVVIDIEKELEVENNELIIKQDENDCVHITHLDKKTFFERYLNHIPPDKIVMVRYCGLYSNRHREDYKKARKQVKNESKKEEDEPYIELCPLCNGEMRVAFRFKRDELYLILEIRAMKEPPIHGYIINSRT